MASFSPETWALIALVAGVAVIAILYTLAAQMREQVGMHDLKRRVHTLHEQYTSRLTAMRAKARALEELESLARRAPPQGPANDPLAPPTAPSGAPLEADFDFVDEPQRAAA